MFDMKNLSRLKKLDEVAPQPTKAFWAFDKAAFAPGALDVLTKQLMAVAVALTTQCPYCIALHNKAAREAGASDAQLAESRLMGWDRSAPGTWVVSSQATRSSCGRILSAVFVSKSRASWRSRNWVDGSPDVRLTMRPRLTVGRSRSISAHR